MVKYRLNASSVPDSGVLCLPPASRRLWQASLLACQGEFSDPSQFLKTLIKLLQCKCPVEAWTDTLILFSLSYFQNQVCELVNMTKILLPSSINYFFLMKASYSYFHNILYYYEGLYNVIYQANMIKCFGGNLCVFPNTKLNC